MRRQGIGLAIVLLCGTALADETPTGVIVDASLLDIKRCRFPKLYDPDGVMLYPPSSLFSNAEYMQGYSGFMPSVAEARKRTERVGENPWIVRPTALHEADPTCGSVDLDKAQSDRLAEIETATGVLAKDRVLIVVGLAVAGSTPAPDAVDVPPDATVSITVSKALRAGHRERLELYQQTVDGEFRVSGQVNYVANTRTMVFRPGAPFTPGATYQARLPADLQAETMATLGEPYLLTFTIAKPPAATDSEPGADTQPTGDSDSDSDAGDGPGADGGGSGTAQGGGNGETAGGT